MLWYIAKRKGEIDRAASEGTTKFIKTAIL